MRHLIACPELIEFCKQGRFFQYANKIYLIKGQNKQNMPEYLSYVKFITTKEEIKLNELPNSYDDTLKNQRATALSNLQTVINSFRKQFQSFQPTTPEAYRAAIGKMINTILPAWLQYRFTYIPFG